MLGVPRGALLPVCGIAGFIDFDKSDSADSLRAKVMRMADALRHRGPDDSGTWADAGSGVAFGHRRLSILDLSSAGAQPMTSACGRYTLVYNGETYNFRELRGELEDLGSRFRGHSDTEVVVEAIGRWGVEGAIERIDGMFAFAVWDGDERRLWLVRDRIGKKPLYYGWCGRRFYFASELKAIHAAPGFRASVDRDALGLLVRYSSIPAPHCIYAGLRKLEAGSLVALQADEGPVALGPRCFWAPREPGEKNAIPGHNLYKYDINIILWRPWRRASDSRFRWRSS